MDFKSELLQRKNRVENILIEYFRDKQGHQKTVVESMEYSINAGGKRLRPILLIEVCKLLGGNEEAVARALALVQKGELRRRR